MHGFCTLALASRALREAAGVTDPTAVRRLAVRFSAPVFPGDALTTAVWSLGDGSYGFEMSNGDGRTVLKDGRAEFKSIALRADALERPAARRLRDAADE